MRRLKQLKEEKRRLKEIVADQPLDIRALKGMMILQASRARLAFSLRSLSLITQPGIAVKNWARKLLLLRPAFRLSA